jgi:hypothetical protein
VQTPACAETGETYAMTVPASVPSWASLASDVLTITPGAYGTEAFTFEATLGGLTDTLSFTVEFVSSCASATLSVTDTISDQVLFLWEDLSSIRLPFSFTSSIGGCAMQYDAL